ncbi:MAG: Proline-tRNA ligase [Parcubacteria group bacterium GW2011_GWA2_40_8]|nr:MAG: Proline-tRNA ligase [Parcubacteria group bacterium GW2011_GWB1_40_14]KKR79128.1 MAG: Proline-tRNA ligase [Parcubacteria group bacterium GW2011_GWA2_40_8]
MKQSLYFAKTRKETPKDAQEISHKLLMRGDYIDQLASGIYTLLPLGLRVHQKIVNIIREEMNGIGSQELLMPALHPKSIWTKTGRWNVYKGEMYQFEDKSGHWFGLGPTHEEIITTIVANRINSFRDLPQALYQIQTKFRDEARPKAGLLRGKEFIMKDLYSFHATKEDFDKFYETVTEAYLRIFKRCGVDAFPVQASGGAFTKEITREFMIKTGAGEDTTLICDHCGWAANKEVAENLRKKCPKCGGEIKQYTTVEAGHVFHLGTGFSEKLGASFIDENGDKKPIIMGCYGLGTTRIMASVVEVNNDKKGIIWPSEVAPFSVHILSLGSDIKVKQEAQALEDYLQKEGIEVLYDDRDLSAGEKFADADLLGIPLRAVISEKTLSQGMVEIKYRKDTEARLVTRGDLINAAKTKN